MFNKRKTDLDLGFRKSPQLDARKIIKDILLLPLDISFLFALCGLGGG